MAENLLHHLRMDVLGEQQRRACVPEVVDTNPRELGGASTAARVSA